MALTFEDFIIKCCKVSEPELRRWMRKILPRFNFVVQEDDYLSDRCDKDESFKTVHNLLAIRGKTPRVCLVAHTDVCRDHKGSDKRTMYYGDPKKKPEGSSQVDPVLKVVEVEEEGRKIKKRIIQDRTQDVQVGGDDRLGVAINLWIALNTGYDMGLYFPTDEEIGLRSARKVEFKELKDFALCAQVDRGNHTQELVTRISDTHLCDYDTTVRLLEIAYDIGRPRRIVSGNGTDVLPLKQRGFAKNAVNMTCGYHSSHSSGGEEYICIQESIATLHYVSAIVQTYNLD